MLVKFRSTATGSITMFGDVAIQLLQMMGASGKVPGALNPQDVTGALQRLTTAIENINALPYTETAAPPAYNEDESLQDAADDEDEDENRDRNVSLATRAVPLISLLKRAAAANAEVIWEAS